MSALRRIAQRWFPLAPEGTAHTALGPGGLHVFTSVVNGASAWHVSLGGDGEPTVPATPLPLSAVDAAVACDAEILVVGHVASGADTSAIVLALDARGRVVRRQPAPWPAGARALRLASSAGRVEAIWRAPSGSAHAHGALGWARLDGAAGAAAPPPFPAAPPPADLIAPTGLIADVAGSAADGIVVALREGARRSLVRLVDGRPMERASLEPGAGELSVADGGDGWVAAFVGGAGHDVRCQRFDRHLAPRAPAVVVATVRAETRQAERPRWLPATTGKGALLFQEIEVTGATSDETGRSESAYAIWPLAVAVDLAHGSVAPALALAAPVIAAGWIGAHLVVVEAAGWQAERACSLAPRTAVFTLASG